MTTSDVAHSVREERAFYNATGDPFVFPTDAFIGRARELPAVQQAIASATSRLVTLVGPAGVGKTRLALEAARTADERFPGGAVIVRLAAIERVGDIIPEIARALGMIDQAEKLDTLVREALAAEPSVLLLDCFEHLIPHANEIVARLLADCPQLHILLTSRRPTGLPGEHVLEVHPLSLGAGGSLQAAQHSEAVQLFVDRARKARGWFTLDAQNAPVVNMVCARYDGLPLAIELLASWIPVLSLKELLEWKPEDLEYRIPVQDPRHQSLLDAIAWSFGLLPPDAQTLLVRLSAFTGGFSRDLVEKMAQGREAGAAYPHADGYGLIWEASYGDEPYPWEDQDPAIAQALAPIDSDAVKLLATLIDHRLVYQSGEIDGAPRFDMLEAIREFGRSQMTHTSQEHTIRHAHAAAILAFAEASGEGLWQQTNRLWSRERVDAELQNIRAAIGWSFSLGPAAAEIPVRIAGPLWPYWQTRGLITEGRRYLDEGLHQAGLSDWCRIKDLPGLAFLCWIQGDDVRCQEVVEETLALTGEDGFINDNARGTTYLVMALLEFRKGIENVFTMMDYVERAEVHFQRIARASVPIGLGACYLIYGQVCRLTGDTTQALELFERGFELHDQIGYEWGAAAGRYFSAEAYRDLAETDRSYVSESVTRLHDALQRFWNLGDFWGAGGAMSGLACILAMQGVDLQAATYFGAAQVLMGRVGGSLLPSELMTHHETETELQARMPAAVWREAFALGQANPDKIVEQALADAAALPNARPLPRLTRTQLSIVQDLVQGYDVSRIAERRGRSLSATYELVDRIVVKLDLTKADEIAAFAVKSGLVTAPSARLGFIPPK